MSEARVHRVRFYNVEPKAIHCMAYDTDNRKIALSRFVLMLYIGYEFTIMLYC